MKRLIPAAVIVVGALAFASIAAVQLNGADADGDPQAALPQNPPSPNSVVADTSPVEPTSADGLPQIRHKDAYVGITLTSLTEDEAHAAGIVSGALIESVLADGPADGLLEDGDVITFVNHEPVFGPTDVVDAVRSSSPEEVMAFSIMRGGDAIDVEITLGEREASLFAFRFNDFSPGHDLTERLHEKTKAVVRSEFVTEMDDGFQTTTTIVGTVENVDVEAGTFDLVPVDGTDTVHFEIDDETRVAINHEGDISGLNPGERTLVVEVETADGDRIVRLVSQGQNPGHFGGAIFGARGHFRGPGLRFRGYDDGRSFVEVLPGHLPDIRERLRSFLSDQGLEDLRERGFELEHFLDKIPGKPVDGQ